MPAGKEKHLGVVVLLWYLCVCVLFVVVLFGFCLFVLNLFITTLSFQHRHCP